MPDITVGVEVEEYKITLTDLEKETYRKQLKLAEKSLTIRQLGIERILEVELHSSRLCMIEKNGIPFMEVVFDDINKMGQLEFISAVSTAPPDFEYKGGVKSYEKFFTQQNIEDISIAVEYFPALVQQACNSDGEAKIAFERGDGEADNYTYKVPIYAQSLLRDKTFEDGTGAVHLTHSIPSDQGKGFFSIIKEFIYDNLSLKSEKKEGSDEESDLSPSNFIANARSLPSHSYEGREKYVDELDKAFPTKEGSEVETSERNSAGIIFKMPKDYLFPKNKVKNTYVQLELQKEVLPPTTNLVEYTVNTIEIYKELKEELINKQAALEEDEDKVISEKLDVAIAKLDKTIEELTKQVVRAVADVPAHSDKELAYDDIKNDIKSYLNIAIFDSYDEKFQLEPLVEHRTGEVQQSLKRIIKTRAHTAVEAVDTVCATLQEKFKQLKEKIEENKKRDRSESPEQKAEGSNQQQEALPKKEIKNKGKGNLFGEEDDYDNFHLKRVGKKVGETYNIREYFTAINSNLDLLDKLSKQAVVTADIDLKAVEVKNDVAPDKVGKVEFLAEKSHIKDHLPNTRSLIARIKSGDIGKDTVIAIERKSYGNNLGMPDVIKLAHIVEHNERHPENQLKFPEEITKGSLIYQDAMLYNTAKKYGVKVIGLEGKNLETGKDSPEQYNNARDNYMADRIIQLISKGYNVIAYVGSAHVDNLTRVLENKFDEVLEKDTAGISKLSNTIEVEVDLGVKLLTAPKNPATVMETVWQEAKKQAEAGIGREINMSSPVKPMSKLQSNVRLQTSESMEEAWVQAENKEVTGLSTSVPEEVSIKKKELATMHTSWKESQLQSTKVNITESIPKLPKAIQQQPVEPKGQQTHIDQKPLPTQFSLNHTAQKAVVDIARKIVASAAETLRMAMYVDPYEVAVASMKGYAVQPRTTYRPELRDALLQYKLVTSGNKTSGYGNFQHLGEGKANDTLPPLGALIDTDADKG